MPHQDKYRCFAELQKFENDQAYRIITVPRDSETLIIAPHGGKIEPKTSAVAEAIAGDDRSLYLFEGRKKACNYDTLHITSTRFEEPSCLGMMGSAQIVLAVHGCRGHDGELLYMGGLDQELSKKMATALAESDYDVRTEGHPWPGTDPSNVCNGGVRRVGVQLELSKELRDQLDVQAFAAVVRRVMAEFADDLEHGKHHTAHLTSLVEREGW